MAFNRVLFTYGNETLFDWIIFLISRVYFFFIRIPFVLFWSTRKKERVLSSDERLLNLSAAAIALEIREKRVTVTEVVETFLSRARAANPKLKAIVVDTYEDARREARELDAELAAMSEKQRKELAKSRPLLGVPFTNKEHISVKGLPVNWGVVSIARKRVIPEANALVVQRMKDAGAILVGQTNLPEAIFYAETHNNVYGVTSNPHDLRRTAGGSSGGEGAAVASQMSPFGIGTDGAGSSRIPAAFCGCFALKPSAGLIPGEGLEPKMDVDPDGRAYAWTVGPIGRHTSDIKEMFKVIADDVVRSPGFGLDAPVDLKKVRLFYSVPAFTQAEWVGCDQMEALVSAMKFLESKLDTPAVRLDPPLLYRIREFAFNRYQFGKPGSTSLWGVTHDPPGTYDKMPFSPWEYVRWLWGSSQHNLLLLVCSTYEWLGGWGWTAERKEELLEETTRLQREIVTALGENGVLLLPAYPTTANFHYQSASTYLNWLYTCIANVLGLPAVMVPMGKDRHGMPTAVQILGGLNKEPLLFAISEELEKQFGGWVKVK